LLRGVFPEVRSLSREVKSLPRSLDKPRSVFASESSSGCSAFCVGVSGDLPAVLLSRLNVMAVIGVTLVTSVSSELSKSEGNEISSMDKVTLPHLSDPRGLEDKYSIGGELESVQGELRFFV
jgi:hypothetical protein